MLTTRKPSPKASALISDPAAIRARILAEKARRSGSKSFETFLKQAWSQFETAPLVWNWHMSAVCMHLQEFALGNIRKLLITMPPRCAKSNMVSIAWPAWRWTIAPHKQTLFLSYSASLSIEHSVKCRQVIESPWYQEIYRPEWELRPDQNTKHDFVNTAGGRRRATSITGNITGHGGDDIVFDDPLNANDAFSEPARNEANRVVGNVMATRLNDPATGGLCMIMQRLHENDPADLFLKSGDVEHVCLPAEFDTSRRAITYHFVSRTDGAREREELWRDPRTVNGELLFPTRLTRQFLDNNKKPQSGLGADGYEAQFQQQPGSFEGGMFRRADWRFYKPDGRRFEDWTVSRPRGCTDVPALPLPPLERIILSVDAAFKDNPGGSQVAIHVWGRCRADRFLLYRDTDHMDFGTTKQRIRTACAMFPALEHKLIEEAANGAAIINELRHEIPMIIPVRPEGGKEARAAATQPYQRAGNVYLPDGAPWADEYVRVFAIFPRGTKQDDVDAQSQALRELEDRAVGETGNINWNRR